MKKILSSVAAIALAAALISCGDSGDTNNTITNSDTIISVGTPVVTGKAYPGVNYITWTPVANATRYEIYRTAGNAATEYLTAVSAQGGELGYADFASDNKDLVDGVTYKYTIFAVGGNNSGSGNVPSRAVYIATSTASATVKAKVPAYGTDLTKFAAVAENDADYKKIGTHLSELSEKKGVLEAKNVNNTHIAVAYPVIPGLKYAVKAVNESHLAAGLSTKKYTGTSWTSAFAGARTANCNLNDVVAFGPGKYTAYLTVSALSDLYTTEAVYSLGEVTFAQLDDTTPINNVYASWASDGKSVNITWEQAKLGNGTKEALANYHVYRAVGSYNALNFKEGVEITEVTKDVKVVSKVDSSATGSIGSSDTVNAAAVVTTGVLKEVCYMVDATADAKTPYTYIVTHANNNGVSTPKFSSITAWSKETTNVPSFVITGNNGNVTGVISRKDKENTVIKVVGKRANDYQTLSLAYYKLDDVTAGVYKQIIPSDFTAGDITKNNDATNETWTGYIEATVGTYVLKLTASDSRGKAEASAYYVVYVTGVGDPNASGITITQPSSGTKYMSVDNLALVRDYSLTDADFNANKYKYYLTTVTVKQANTTFVDDVTIETATTSITLAKHSTTTTSDASNDQYVAYGIMAGGSAQTDSSYSAIVSGIKSETPSTGTSTVKVFSVKKTNASDEAHLYAYSTGSTGKLTK